MMLLAHKIIQNKNQRTSTVGTIHKPYEHFFEIIEKNPEISILSYWLASGRKNCNNLIKEVKITINTDS